MRVTAIIAAAGRGERFGGARPKQLLAIGDRTVLERSVAAFVGHPAIDEVIVALPPELAAAPLPYLRDAPKPVHIVVGGRRRQDSVANAFRAASLDSEVIVIHDAARPFASTDLIDRVLAAAAESGAALAALPARDTVKLAGREAQEERKQAALMPGPAKPERLFVHQTLPRESVFLAQTPQAFRREVLRDALALATEDADATDEASLAERAGHRVRLVAGEMTNIKITTPDDVPVAEAIARGGKPARTLRAGIGYDVHRLVEGRPLVLGGVTIPFERGLLGHSDADAVCHALTDAVLGAAGAGDIGRHFPDSDPRWGNASSLDLLRQAAGMIRELGLEVGNVDASVIAERPKLAPYIDAMRSNVAEALGIAPDRVSIKGKTNEGIGALGRGEAIAVHAIAVIRQR